MSVALVLAGLLGCGRPETPAPPAPSAPAPRARPTGTTSAEVAGRLTALRDALDLGADAPMHARVQGWLDEDLPRLADPGLSAWPREVVLSAAALPLVERLALADDADVPVGLPARLVTLPGGAEVRDHLRGLLDPSVLAGLGDRSGSQIPRRELADLAEVLTDDLAGLCDGTPPRQARWDVLIALLEARAEVAELDPQEAARSPWAWADPSALRGCSPSP